MKKIKGGLEGLNEEWDGRAGKGGIIEKKS